MRSRILAWLVAVLLVAQAASGYLIHRTWQRANLREAYTRLTYAQHAEDLVIATVFEYLGSRVETYLDVGAWDPVHDSNTYLFYRAGARGVLVEANPDYAQRLRDARPGDTVLAVGMGGDERREAPYFVVEDGSSGWNTFSAGQAAQIRATGKSVRETRLPMVPVNEVLEEHFGRTQRPLDLLSIDVEGLDLAILQSWDFERYRPKVICAETKQLTTNGQVEELIELVLSKGYELRAATFVNSIFVDRAWIERP